MTFRSEVSNARVSVGPLYLHLIDSLQVGGAQTHLLTMLGQAIRTHPASHRVVSLSGDGPIGDKLRDLGLPVDMLDLRGYCARRQFFAASELLSQLCRKYSPQLVEAHLTWSRILGLYAAWKSDVPIRIGFEQGDVYLDSWKFRAANFVGQYFADRTIVCSEALGDWSRRTHGIARRKLLVLHNCVDVGRFTPRRNLALRASWKFPDNSTVFTCVGTLGRGVNKRVDIIIRAVSACRSCGEDVALVVCGDGEQRPELERLASELGIRRVVQFLGTRGDVPEVLAACDVFAHAAPFEPFGIVAIEAMATGLPVIVPNSGGIREAVEDGKTGLLYPPLNHLELSRNITLLHRDRAQRERIGRQARHAVEQKFSVTQYIAKLYRMYERVSTINTN